MPSVFRTRTDPAVITSSSFAKRIVFVKCDTGVGATLSLEHGRGVGFSAFLVLRSWGREDPAGVFLRGWLPVAASTGVVCNPAGIPPVIVMLFCFGAVFLHLRLVTTPESVSSGPMEPRVLQKLFRIGHTR
ncbi:hypothetical protein NDU88_005363 [Pleurodeles waltl]|uniref:Uncharacterized protein n=1 Tax=Pleurodeles waltl TaxID=8319 RepID=A0AAV7WD57_PLEWA|nr:hypothetical protein NDU88_005363 [Pleurodeles waltl]